MPLQVNSAPDDPDLLFLPWAVPLEEWPEDQLVALPRGLSRHVVRFVHLSGRVYAVKETPEEIAWREYRMLRQMETLRLPTVEAVAVVRGRETAAGEPLQPALVTAHLIFSLPYRALFSSTLRPGTAQRLLDALAVLLVRLHIAGFSWGDCSLSNTLFRRDAGSFAAYLVDAETAEMHHTLSDGQRLHDLDLARTNIFGELSDLAAGGILDESVDPEEASANVVRRYTQLRDELVRPLEVGPDERYVLDAHIERLNQLGFDVEELEVTAQGTGARVRVLPKVVDAGHHSRRLFRLTGLDAEENQARRMLNDLDSFRSAAGLPESQESVAAHRWVTEVFEPVMRAVPKDQRGKLEAPQLFHEVLEHRWFLSEAAGRDVGLNRAVQSYMRDVLAAKPVEAAVLGRRIGPPPVDTGELRLSFRDDGDDDNGGAEHGA